MDTGIKAKDRKVIAEGLSKLLADTYTLYLKTHYFHWNVTGPMFNTLHLMFETQYTELALAVDLVATARSVFPAAEAAADEATADLLTQRLQLHEKTAWMLRSLLE
ncbi:MAG: hypothetical protein B7Y32_03005 [Methylophilales bacterium 16-45-7]|nr:MAG: hypothetical protein B7Y32_03005 [Methylophilales bacterium 16-45-7]